MGGWVVMSRRAYSCEISVGFNPVAYDALRKSQHKAVEIQNARRRADADIVLSSSLARSHGRIVAKVSLDVSHDDMAVDALSWHEPLPSELAVWRHGARSAR